MPIVNKDNKKVPQMKAILNHLTSVGDPGSEDMMAESVIEYLPKTAPAMIFASVGYEIWRSRQ